MKRILLTGGAGFIGSWLTAKLLQNGTYFVTSIDNFDPFYPRAIKERNIARFMPSKNYRFIEGDICNSDDLEKARDSNVIVHLAAKAGVRPSFKEPRLYYDVNTGGTLNLLEYARNKSINQFIFASSSSVYGKNPNRPWHESEELKPISPYASSKVAAEELGREYSHRYNIHFLALRFFTVYGPGQRPDLAICKFFNAIMNDRPLDMYGDGSASRDYTYVEDIVAGLEAAINSRMKGFNILNLGNKSSITLRELISTIGYICRKEPLINYLPSQEGDAEHTCAAILMARTMLSYTPRVTLIEGLTSYYKWLRASGSANTNITFDDEIYQI